MLNGLDKIALFCLVSAVATENSTLDPVRRRRILDTALAIFLRFGFRKTSMDEVARAADISRQGLYLYFQNKEDLFRDTIRTSLSDGLAAAEVELSRDAPIGARLVGALDAWFGRHVGTPGVETEDLLERSRDLLGDMLGHYRSEITGRLARSIAASPLANRVADLGLEPMDVARTLHACGLTWKHSCTSQAEFSARMATAVRLITGGDQSC
jgi:AcrR family transcriptional regulator